MLISFAGDGVAEDKGCHPDKIEKIEDVTDHHNENKNTEQQDISALQRRVAEIKSPEAQSPNRREQLRKSKAHMEMWKLPKRGIIFKINKSVGQLVCFEMMILPVSLSAYLIMP